MNLCSDEHDEICYEGRKCPACAVIKEKQEEIDSLEAQVEKLEDKVGDLEGEVRDLNRQLDDARD